MNFKAWLLALLFAYANQSTAQKSTTVMGEFESATPGDTVYLESNEGIKYSSVINNNNSVEFKFEPHISDIYFIRYKGLSKTFMFPIFVEEGAAIKIEVNKKLAYVRFTGDQLAKEQNTFYLGLIKRYDTYIEIQNKIDTTTDSSELAGLQKTMLSINKDYQDYYSGWVKNRKESPFSAAVIALYIHNGAENDTIAAKHFNMLDKTATANNYVAWSLSSKFSILNDSISRAPIGTKAPDFYISDTSGNTIKLNDFKGKYLLIDFWASWCEPCRTNNPLLKDVYNKYKGKGLKLLSISIDVDSNAWKKAIIKDGLNWENGSDLKYYHNNSVAFNYGIDGVPDYILIDPAQNIIFKSRGGDIQKTILKLKEVFGD